MFLARGAAVFLPGDLLRSSPGFERRAPRERVGEGGLDAGGGWGLWFELVGGTVLVATGDSTGRVGASADCAEREEET